MVLSSSTRAALVCLVTAFYFTGGVADAELAMFSPPSLSADQTTVKPLVDDQPAKISTDAGRARLFAEPRLAQSQDQGEPHERPSSDTKNASDSEQPLGEAPPDGAIDFFRQSNVLLRPGTLEMELAFEYANFETGFLTILPDATITPESTAARTYLATLSLRYGLSEKFQPFIAFPAGLASTERANGLDEASDDNFGIGDCVIGSSILLRDGRDKCSDVVASVALGIPTGQSDILAINPQSAVLGNGFWSLSGNVNWTRTFDPVVMFVSTGYAHRFARTFVGQEVRPGGQVDLATGFGLAINDEITYSMQFDLSHQFDTKIAGIDVENSGVDVANVRHSLIVRTAPQRFFEVFITNGITDAATDVATGVIFTRRY